MRIFSRATVFSGLANVFFDLTAAWLAVILVGPGFFNTPSNEYLFILLENAPLSMLSFVAGLFFLERSKL